VAYRATWREVSARSEPSGPDSPVLSLSSLLGRAAVEDRGAALSGALVVLALVVARWHEVAQEVVEHGA
jgi:hypothetical protein